MRCSDVLIHSLVNKERPRIPQDKNQILCVQDQVMIRDARGHAGNGTIPLPICPPMRSPDPIPPTLIWPGRSDDLPDEALLDNYGVGAPKPVPQTRHKTEEPETLASSSLLDWRRFFLAHPTDGF